MASLNILPLLTHPMQLLSGFSKVGANAANTMWGRGSTGEKTGLFY